MKKKTKTHIRTKKKMGAQNPNTKVKDKCFQNDNEKKKKIPESAMESNTPSFTRIQKKRKINTKTS